MPITGTWQLASPERCLAEEMLAAADRPGDLGRRSSRKVMHNIGRGLSATVDDDETFAL